MNLRIVEASVTDTKLLKDFFQAPFAVFQDDPHWVAPLFLERKDHFNPKKNPYFEHADVQLFVAYLNDKPVGRVTAQNDRLRLETLKDNKGMFGFLDAIDNHQVFEALTSTAADWLRSKGRSGMIGPFSFSINDESGMLVDGFDTPPNMMMGHGRQHYAHHMERLGFQKSKDLLAYNYTLQPLPRALDRVMRRAIASGEFKIRPINLSKIRDEISVIMDIFNDAWSGNWGFVPFTARELEKLGKDLKLLVNNNYGYIVSYKGEDAAFLITLPNLNEIIQGMNGRVMPFNWIKILTKLIGKKPKSVRVPLMGVRKKLQGSPAGSIMSTMAIDAVRTYHIARGCKTAELSWVLEDNLPMRKIAETLDAIAYKTYRIYEKAL